jgi:hypothetical protein
MRLGTHNCIAYAAGVETEWWSHERGYRWPAFRSPLINSLVAVFKSLGYKKCKSAKLQKKYLKVAIYERNGLWTHAARQEPDGKWKSKLGPDEDIEHDSPDCLCGDSYGAIHCIMRKAKDVQKI